MVRISKVAKLFVEGARHIDQISRPRPGVWGRARRMWGWELLPLFAVGPVILAINPFLHSLLWRQSLGNPFTMTFPIQAGEMATAILTSSLFLFPLLASYLLGRLRQRGVPPQPGLELVLPIFWAALLSIFLLQSVYLVQEVSILAESGKHLAWGAALVHFVRNMLLHGVWMVLFLLVSIRHPGEGLGLTMSIFFSLQGLLFARGFIPHFGILDMLEKHFLDFGHQDASISAVMASLVTMVLAGGLICLLWALFQQRLQKVCSVAEGKMVPPPIPTEKGEN